jgi:ornithine racemase
MRKYPCLEFDLGKIRHNATTIQKLCSVKGIKIVGITKGFSAIPEIVQTMIDSGIKLLGDSRLENIQSLKTAGFKNEMMLIRIPMLHEVEQVVRLASCSLNSEIVVLEALSSAAVEQGKIHEIILMVDLGDLREGVLPEQIRETIQKILPLKGIRLMGLGVNLNCVSGIQPTVDNLTELVTLCQKTEKELGLNLKILSGGATSSLALVTQDTMPKGINQLRIGEGILLGHTDIFTSLNNTFQDAITLSAEIIELKQKESTPRGLIFRDAFGQIPKHQNVGVRKRAILAIGKQDVYPDHLSPLDKALNIIAASSDHLVVDVTDSSRKYRVGEAIQFQPSYPGILSATTSKYVSILFKHE